MQAEHPPLQKTPPVGLCQASCATTHLVCNPGIREVRGNLFIHFSSFGTEPGAHITLSKGLLIRWFISLFFPGSLK